jgi:hypothetical protein
VEYLKELMDHEVQVKIQRSDVIMESIEIQKPNSAQKEKFEKAQPDFERMMETVKPFSKKRTIIRHDLRTEWHSCD